MKCFYPVAGRPCGQCSACMVNKSLQWKFRLEHEVLSNDLALWLTLQYDDDHLIYAVRNRMPVVWKLHCQNYFRQLRKYIVKHKLKVSFKYFLVSEYGPQTLRPHYHVLMLFQLPQIPFDRMLQMRQTLYEQCKERWYHGHCQEKLFHSGVIKYLTKYVFKPFDDFDPDRSNFRLISKGIGLDFLDKVPEDIISHDWRTPYGVLPRYYRDKLYPTSVPEYKKLREEVNRRVEDSATASAWRELSKFGNSIDKYIKNQQYLLQCQKRLVERKQRQKYG